MSPLSIEPPAGWSVSRLSATRAADPFLARLLAERPLELEETFAVRPSRGAEPGALAVTASGTAARALVVRHGSGALTFHGPEEARRARFTVPLRTAAPARGWLVRTRDHIAERALAALAARWERARFSSRRRPAGFVAFDARSVAKGALPSFDAATLPPPPARSLLLVHGIASDAASAFGELARTRGADGRTLLARLSERYDGRILAFNHPTVSATPEENARALLAALPARGALFDVITHSRGGVVARTLAETRAGDRRFDLGRAVLVAAPNEGSALAAPERWATWVSWLANLLDLFRGSFADGMSLAAESLVWLAHRVEGALPGVAALAPGSPTLAALGGSAARYAAVGASFGASGLLARMGDAGVSPFFQEAHDLVVPAAGTFPRGIPAGRAACFGRGGNLRASGVHHVNLFAQPECVDVIGAFLEEKPLDLAPFDPRAPLPFGRALRGGVAGRRTASAPSVPRARRRAARSDAPMEIVILGHGRPEEGAQVLAMYRGARVSAALPTRGGAAGERMRRVIAFQERTLASFLGRGAPPNEEEIRAAGALLFETLLSGDVLRLYDRARGEAALLDLRLTSDLAWIADKPWEIVFDPSRGAFLALDGVRLSRGVFGVAPTPAAPRKRGALRILVVAAQPGGTAPLSLALEEAAVRHAFASLSKSGRAKVDVVRRATPARLHDRIARTLPDVVHFIGHGEWDAKARTGRLLLEDARGAVHALDAPTLRALLTARGLSLVVLNACETGRGGRHGLARGVAQSLVAGGVPAVVANQYPVIDEAAGRFAAALAEALASGSSVGDAVREARVALATDPASALDWSVPVLHERDGGRSLFAAR